MNLPDPQLRPTITTEEAAKILGVGKWLLYDLARQGRAPVTPLRLGRTLRWPTARLLAALGVESPAATDRRECA